MEGLYSFGSLNLELNVPKVNGNFRPHILPEPYKRADSEYLNLLGSLIVNGYSESNIVSSLKELGLPYSKQDIELIKQELQEKLEDFKRRQLPTDVFCLFIDGYHTQIKDKNKVKSACIYVRVEVALEGRKDVYGLYTVFGNENKGRLRNLQ